MLTRDEYELKGRVVTQYFFDELEKIAYSNVARRLVAQSGAAQRHLQVAQNQMGMRRFVPFTQAHRTYFGHAGQAGSGVRSRAVEAQRTANAQVAKETAALQKAVGKGKGNIDKHLKMLEEGPKLRQQAATAAPEPGQGWSTGQLAAGATGLGLAAGAGMYGMHKLRQNQQQGYGGGGY